MPSVFAVLEVDDEFEFDGLLNGQVGTFLTFEDTATRAAKRAHDMSVVTSGHSRLRVECPLCAKGDNAATTAVQSDVNTFGSPVTSGAMLGELSGSTRLNLQISPFVAKVASTSPPNCLRARENSRVPKP